MLDDTLASLRLTGAITARERPSVSAEPLLMSLVTMPPEHITLLRTHDGLEAYGGYFRLFGVDASVTWNADEYWKFAWGERASDFWCFGETAWGDQYAYSTIDTSGRVYFLDCLSMTAKAIAPNFERFMIDEFLRCAINPYDELIVEARERFGDLQPGAHLLYSPSPLLGGADDISNVMAMDARTAMIFNGDVALQLDAAAEDSLISSVEPYEDAEGRSRLRLNWS